MPSLINSFTATPESIVTGGTSILKWDTVEGSTVELTSFGTVENVGLRFAKPTVTTEYTLQAKKEVYTSTRRITVTVDLAPLPHTPPLPDTYHLIFYTAPDGCVIELVDYGFELSDSKGYAIFKNLPSAVYEYNISKTGYITHNNSVFLSETKTRFVTLEEEPPPPEGFTLTVYAIPNYCYVNLDGTTEILSGDDGVVLFPQTSAGLHTVTVSKQGFEPRTLTINLLSDHEMTVDITGPPNFWTNPIEWIQYFVITTLDSMLQWQGGTFVSLLYNIKYFFDNSWSQIHTFFSDSTGFIVQAVKDNLNTILAWQSVQLINFFDWITTLTSTNFEALKTFLGDVGDFVGTAFTGFVDWLSTLGGTVAEYISSQVEGFLLWGEGLLTDIWEGIEGWVIDLIVGLIDSFQTGFDQGIEDQKNLRNQEEE